MRHFSVYPRHLFYVLILISILPLVSLAACVNSPAVSTASTAATASPGGTTAAASERVFTTTELAAYDGQNGNKAYIAVDGIVYDVTAVAQWANKLHAGKFRAGKDYSAEIKTAPHGVEKLATAVRIGILKN